MKVWCLGQHGYYFFFELALCFKQTFFFRMFAKDRVIQRNPLNSGNHRTTNDVIKNVVFVLKFFILISFILQEDSNRQVEAEETISRALEGYYRRKGQRKEIRAYSRSRYVRGLRAHSSNSSKYFVM